MKFVKLHTPDNKEIAVNINFVSDLFYSEKIKATIICFGNSDYEIHVVESIDEIIERALK